MHACDHDCRVHGFGQVPQLGFDGLLLTVKIASALLKLALFSKDHELAGIHLANVIWLEVEREEILSVVVNIADDHGVFLAP